MDDILLRIKLILEKEGISPAELADSIGIGRPLLSHIFSGRNKPSLQVVLKILERYPTYSADWLLLGNENAPKINEPAEIPKAAVERKSIEMAVESQTTKNTLNANTGLPEVILMMFDDKTYEAYKLRK